MYALEKFRRECVKAAEKAGISGGKIRLENPPREIEADLAMPCFGFGKNPVETAKELSLKINKGIKKASLIGKAEAAGPYLNFSVSSKKFPELVMEQINDMGESYGSEKKKSRKIIIDFSSPNIAKPMNIGHLRSTIIGQSLYNIHGFLGYNCIGDNHVGDWGTQFGKLIAAYKRWGNEKELEKGSVSYLASLYIRFHKEEEKSPELAEEGREWFRKLEKGDKEARKLWKRFYEISMREFEKVYDILGVKFDIFLGESFYYRQAEKIIKNALEKGVAEKSQGAVVIKTDEMPPLLIQKADESTLYATRDLSCIKYRLEKFRPEKILYVIGSEQKLYMRQLFEAAEKLGMKGEFVHIDFGMVRLGGCKMSTREGRFVLLNDIISESITRAEKIIEEKNPGLKNRKEVAKKVGVGAIIFNDLKHDRVKDIEFDWSKALNLDGDSCPYVQYSYARACSIIRKAGKIKHPESIEFKEKAELSLAKKLSEFPEAVKSSASQYKPSILANYLLELTSTFNDFYARHRVIGSENEAARIGLVKSVKTVIGNGLKLLNIETMAEM